VEDDADARELAEHTLRSAGADVVAVGSAAEAVEELRRKPPAALVSDIGLPYQDGYSLIDAVRKLPAGEGGGVPALAVTAYAREEDRMKALIAGFQGHLTKPFEPEALVSAVGTLVGRHSTSLHPAAAAPAPEDLLAPRDENGEPRPARVLIVEDDRDSREGLRELLQVWGHLVEVAQDGTEGIEKALETQPGVAFIDVGLPGLDGYEVAHRIREAFGQRPILLVALTGYVDSEARRRAEESGFDAHLPKPVNIEKLRPLLEKAVDS
jgi:CheY-like chemotaxis protein